MLRILCLVSVALVAFVTSATGGPNHSGSLILHARPAPPECSSGSVDCETCPTDLTRCEDAITSPEDTNAIYVADVFAAFPSTSSPRLSGATFGVLWEAAAGFSLESMTGCADFELSDPSWPLPGTGTAVTFLEAQTELLVRIAGFVVYAYTDAYGPGELQLGPNPIQGGYFADDSAPAQTDPINAYGALGFGVPGVLPCPAPEILGACCLLPEEVCIIADLFGCFFEGGNSWFEGETCSPLVCPAYSGACCFSQTYCEEMSALNCDTYGGTFLGDNSVCDPGVCSQVGACCLDDECSLEIEATCQSGGGVFVGAGFSCLPDICGILGACCFDDGTCEAMSPHQCGNAAGEFQGVGTTCDPSPCPASGACCLADGTCEVLSASECAAVGGSIVADSCDPSPCPTPVEESSWGRIKNRFR